MSADTSSTSGNGSIIAGDVCGFSTFDFDTFVDEAWEGRTLGGSAVLERQRKEQQDGRESLTESILRTGNLEDAMRLHPKPRARHGKMEKSFFTFQEAHPNWGSCFPPSGQSLVNRVEEYRLSTEQATMARERELHVQAAARQLETLARIEEERNNLQHNMTFQHYHQSALSRRSIHFNDAHYGPTQIPAADAGAGSQSQSPASLSPSPTSGVYRYGEQQQEQQLGSQHRSTLVQTSSIQNSLRSYAENLSTHLDTISSEEHSSAQRSLPFSPSTSASINCRQKVRNDNIIPRGKDDTSIPMFAPQSAESQLFQSQNDSSVSLNIDTSSCQLSSASQSNLASSSSRTASLVERDNRGSHSQHDWLERFHENLEKQQQDVQRHRQQQGDCMRQQSLDSHSSAGTNLSSPEETNEIENHTSSTTAAGKVLRSKSLPINHTVDGSCGSEKANIQIEDNDSPSN